MSKIITDKAQVNNYLQTKNKVVKQKENQRLKTLSERKQLEFEAAMDPQDREFKSKDLILAQSIGSELVKHYPGHGWEVECDIRNGVAKIFNRYTSSIYGYLLHLKLLSAATFSADIMRVGGNLLESFGVSRGKFNQDEITDLKRDEKGCAKVDLL